MAVRKVLIAGFGVLVMAGAAMAQEQNQSQAGSSSAQTAGQTSQQQTQMQGATVSQSADQPVSLGEAARKARQDQKKAPQGKTFTNDDLPAIRSQGLSTVGTDSSTSGAQSSTTSNPATTSKPEDATKDEAYWRKRFADVRAKLDTAQKEMDVLQRELNLAQREYYPDPTQALNEQHSREEINKKTAAIAAKQKQIDDLNQQLSDLQDELRRAGGDAAWGR